MAHETLRRALAEGALVLDAADLGTLVATGPDRTKWLNGMVTCDLAPLHPGDGAYGLAVAKSGKIMAELFVVLATDAVYVGLERARAALVGEHLDKHLIMEDATIADASAEHAWLVLHGPRAAEGAAAAREAGAVVAAIDRTGRGGAVVVAKASALAAVRDAILARLGDRGALARPEAFEPLRIEAGLPRFGVDFDDQTYPQEASLERAGVSFSKGCYLGQEAVFMLEKRGHVKRKLVPLVVEGDADVPAGAEIALPDGTAIGQVTSRAPRPEGGVAALGYVKWKHAAASTEIVVAGRPAKVR
jgi:hypothetical protein